MCKVSIIVPVYNAKAWLHKCLDSLVNQTYKDIEIIIIDDGSTDKSLEIIKAYANKFDNIYYYTQSNKGVSAARNRGISLSNGEYIAFMDADDWAEVNYIEKMIKCIEKEDADFVYCDWIIEQKDGLRIDSVVNYGFNESDYAKELLMFYIVMRTGCAPWGKLYRRSIIEKNEIIFFESLPIAEDYLFIINYLINAQKVKRIQIPLIHYNCFDIGANHRIRFNYLDLQLDILNKLELSLKTSGIISKPYFERQFVIAKLKIYCDMILYLKNIYIDNFSCKNKINNLVSKIQNECDYKLVNSTYINLHEKIIAVLAFKDRIKLIFIITKVRAVFAKYCFKKIGQ